MHLKILRYIQLKVVFIIIIRFPFCICLIENDFLRLNPYHRQPLFDLSSFPLHLAFIYQNFQITDLLHPDELQRPSYIFDKVFFNSNYTRNILRFSENVALNVVDLTFQSKELTFSHLKEVKLSKLFRKSEDRFIFIVKPENQNLIQPMDPIMLEIKYKIIISIKHTEPNREKSKYSVPLISTTIRSFCYFCNEQEMQSLSTSVYDTRIDMKKLFPLKTTKLDLNGRKLRITCPSNAKIRVLASQHKNGTVVISGAYRSISDHLMKGLNFTPEYLIATGGGTGSQLPNGTWIGVVGDVYNERADIGVSVGNQMDRFLYVGFPTPAEYQSLIIISGKHQLVLGWNLLSVPFPSNVWILIGITLIFAVVVVVILQRVLRFLKPPKEGFIFWSNGKIVESLLAAFFEEPVQDPSPHSIRILFSTWLMFALIISNLYRSKLYSALAYPPFEMPPRTYEDLIHSEYKWGLHRTGDASYRFLTLSKNPTYQKIAQDMDIFTDSANCVRETIMRRYACISYTTVLDLVIARNFSPDITKMIKESSHPAFTLGIGIATRKDFPLESDLSKVMGQAVSQHLPSKWLQMFYREIKETRLSWVKNLEKEGEKLPSESGLSKSDGPKQLAFENMHGAFFGLFVGVFIGFGVFCVEIVTLKSIRMFKIGKVLCIMKDVVRFGKIETI